MSLDLRRRSLQVLVKVSSATSDRYFMLRTARMWSTAGPASWQLEGKCSLCCQRVSERIVASFSRAEAGVPGASPDEHFDLVFVGGCNVDVL